MRKRWEAFNSIVELDLQSNRPFNPMINSGAIAVESTIIDYVSFEEMLEYTQRLCSDPGITLNRQVYHSEMNSCDRNRAIAYLLKSKDIITTNVDNSIELYTKMCSLNVTAESLANFALLLANGGICPGSGERLLKEETVRIVLSIMLTCGMYDGSGRFAVEVGVPTKSRRADGPGIRPLRNRDLRSCVGSKGKLHRRLRDDEASLAGNGPAYVSGETKRLLMVSAKHTQAAFLLFERKRPRRPLLRPNREVIKTE